ncbi:hypothetical protein BD779DRAFT_1536312 [Infundibulicybe gibba]|nr:hypothetical protein BD779DRAFT_1536312 [Infundibulicybe gibba]
MNLPVETIQAIFLELCTPQTVFPLRRDEPRLLVTRVCSQWRAIALAMPNLWTNMSIASCDWRSPPLLKADPIPTWISRSAQSALSFRFPNSNHYDPLPIIVGLVFPVIHRCSLLEICGDVATLNWLLALPSGSLRSLQGMSIYLPNPRYEPEHPIPLVTIFQSCPQLRKLVLSTPRGSWSLLNFAYLNVPWHQLSTLRICALILAYECLDVLRQCTSLQMCRFSISPIGGFALKRIMKLCHCPITLPFLHTLRLDFSDIVDNNCHFLDTLRLPHLRNFCPGASFRRPEAWSLSMLRFILCDTIQELDFSEFLSLQCLPEALDLVPNLEALLLGNVSCMTYSDKMRALAMGTIGPHLTTLHFSSVDFHLLLGILEARAAAARADPTISAFIHISVEVFQGTQLDMITLMNLGCEFNSSNNRHR